MIVSELSEGLREIFIKWEQTFRGAVDIYEFTSEQELINFTIDLCKNNINNKIDADLYVMVNGDEPVVMPDAIVKCIPENLNPDDFYVSNLMTDFENPVEVIDATNLKIVTNKDGIALFISRSPIPYPKGDMNYHYHKFVGVGAFTKKALEYYHNTERGEIEKIEENDSFRFIENRKDIYYINAHCKSLSVDTPKDIIAVEEYLTKLGLDK